MLLTWWMWLFPKVRWIKGFSTLERWRKFWTLLMCACCDWGWLTPEHSVVSGVRHDGLTCVCAAKWSLQYVVVNIHHLTWQQFSWWWQLLGSTLSAAQMCNTGLLAIVVSLSVPSPWFTILYVEVCTFHPWRVQSGANSLARIADEAGPPGHIVPPMQRHRIPLKHQTAQRQPTFKLLTLRQGSEPRQDCVLDKAIWVLCVLLYLNSLLTDQDEGWWVTAATDLPCVCVYVFPCVILPCPVRIQIKPILL